MKVIILSEAERFCKDHNFQSIGIKTLREMAITNTEEGLSKAHAEGYAKAHKAVIEALAKEKPKNGMA